MPDRFLAQAPSGLSPQEQHQYAMQLRHKLAMESIGLIRMVLNVQRPVFEALLNAEPQVFNSSPHREILHDKSFAMQLRLVKAAMRFLRELDALANETIELAAKEKVGN
jgi:hypothetical protein